jgi:hypothetical protein
MFSWMREEIAMSLDRKTKNPGNGWHADVFGKKLYVGSSPGPRRSELLASVRPVDEKELPMYRNLEQAGFFLDARSASIAGDGKKESTIGDLLGEAPDLQLRPNPEMIDGQSCRVVEGTTANGRYTLWIDPARGHHVLKYVHELRPGDDLRGKPFKGNLLNTVDGIKLERIDDVWIPVAGRSEQRTIREGKEVYAQKCTCERSEIQLKPDFEAIGAFNVRLPAGTFLKVYRQTDLPDGRYKWTAAPTHIDKVVEALKPATE